MKVIQANTPSEASLLLHAVFQPALKPTPKPDPKIDPGTPLSSSLQVVLSKLTHTSIRNPGLNTCSKTLDEALLHREKETKKEDRGEPEVPPLINTLLTLTLTQIRRSRAASTAQLALHEFRISDPQFSDLRSETRIGNPERLPGTVTRIFKSRFSNPVFG